MVEPDVSQRDTEVMSAIKIESGQINTFALINDMISRGLIRCLICIDERIKFNVKHIHCHKDGWIECTINTDIIVFITKRTPLTLYVSGVL